ncbi:mucosa-associated lymphoid tissue lymphoma translocation protein 1-like [Callospermophilus lateralis]|uniref:mucosa-associated lymphoid tissue lymphoma translocation protein 1-like n=1 Tax=Callospermophilus lateralis TaxID=76772 RepID=UPI004054199A
MSPRGEPLQASPSPALQPPRGAPLGQSLASLASGTLLRLGEPLLRRLVETLDHAPVGQGWRRLAELAGSPGRLRLSCLDLEQCSLKVLEPEGSPSLCLLKLMGEKGCTVAELSDFLQAMEHTEVLQLLSPPGLKITVNPESKAVLAGQFVKLCCRATGHPFVQYQWFKMNKEIPYGNASELIFNTVHVKDAGFYVCRVNNNLTFDFSQWSQLDVCDVTEVTESFWRSPDSLPESRLQICVEPKSQKLMLGSTLVLQCVAIGSPIPHYQWFKNESPLPHETKKLYMVPYLDLEHQGTYWCHVYNDRDSQDSKKVDVIIGRTDEAVECTEDELNDFGHSDNKEQTTDQPLVIDRSIPSYSGSDMPRTDDSMCSKVTEEGTELLQHLIRIGFAGTEIDPENEELMLNISSQLQAAVEKILEALSETSSQQIKCICTDAEHIQKGPLAGLRPPPGGTAGPLEVTMLR